MTDLFRLRDWGASRQEGKAGSWGIEAFSLYGRIETPTLDGESTIGCLGKAMGTSVTL